uniref:Putative ovule protein n=1 Tax=Solanum chacoense TaxID=4108 RepID=A0A0V0H8V3_SOLCH
MFLWCFDYCMILLLFWLLSSRLLHYFLVSFYILLIASFFIPGFVALEPRVFLNQSLYLHEVVVRSAYILSSRDLTCGISPSMLLLLLTCRLSPLYLSNALTLL